MPVLPPSRRLAGLALGVARLETKKAIDLAAWPAGIALAAQAGRDDVPWDAGPNTRKTMLGAPKLASETPNGPALRSLSRSGKTQPRMTTGSP
jgi:hypothetical protein